jgi:hypothetical protein
VYRSRQGREDAPGVRLVLGLADHLAIEPADRVGGEYDAVLDPRGDGCGLPPGEFADVLAAVTVSGVGGFVDVRRPHLEGVAVELEEFPAAERPAGQDQAERQRWDHAANTSASGPQSLSGVRSAMQAMPCGQRFR